MDSGQFAWLHMERVRLRLAEAMMKTITRLKAIGIQPWLIPQAGMFLWCRLPEGINAAAIAQSCLQEGVVLAPGNVFSQSLSTGDFLRFNVAQTTDNRIFSILARACRLAKRGGKAVPLRWRMDKLWNRMGSTPSMG